MDNAKLALKNDKLILQNMLIQTVQSDSGPKST